MAAGGLRSAWIAACILGESLGIAVVATAYAGIDRGVLPGDGAWILAAGAWEGLCLGGAQAIILRRTGVRPLAWVSLTVVGAAVGYGLSLLGGAGQRADGAADVEPALGLLIMLAAVMGLTMGALMGLCQWLSARAQIAPARWIVANAAGWALAMIVIMLAASLAAASWPLGLIAIQGACAGAGAGLLVGVATSLALPARR